jgi:hypothetical protein
VNHKVTKELVRAVLSSPDKLKWSVQGLGMLRTYLSKEVRLHIWDSSPKVYNVSPLHTHPWHLDSYIVTGELRQCRYKLADVPNAAGSLPYNMATIKCGENACTMSDPVKVGLFRWPMESYTEGMTYHQDNTEIHESLPADGTITLVTRTFTEDTEHAQVFWQGNGGFVSAEPRAATPEEVLQITQNALARWF